MKSILVIAAMLVAGAMAQQQCNNDLQSYMKCLDRGLNGPPTARAGELEDEFHRDSVRLAKQCFTTQRNGDRCQSDVVARSSELNNLGVLEWILRSEDSPVASCSMCKTAAKFVFKMFLEAKAETLTCMRKILNEGALELVEPCIREEHPFFRPFTLPDFDRTIARTTESREDAVKSTLHVVLSLLDWRSCRISGAVSPKNSARWQRTQTTYKCIVDKKVGGNPIWPSHCRMMKSCAPNQSCFQEVEATTCSCITKSSRKATRRINLIAGRLAQFLVRNEDSRERKNFCVETVTDTLAQFEKETRTNLKEYLNRLKNCVATHETSITKETLDTVTIDKLVNLGCRAYSRSDSPEKLTKVLVFGEAIMSALLSRTTRFCPGGHCPINPRFDQKFWN